MGFSSKFRMTQSKRLTLSRILGRKEKPKFIENENPWEEKVKS